MRKAKDLTGQKFGRLEVIKRVSETKIKTKEAVWLCKCECGNYKEIRSYLLRKGITTSCGCYNKKITQERSITHGKSKTKIYNVYRSMINRCFNKKVKEYKYYGGRGVTICQEWLKDFINFYNWAISNGYKENLSIDRIDVDGNYEPSNCRWATRKEQANNTRNNHRITYKNETHTIAEWEEKLQFKAGTLKARFQRGWDIEKTLTTPLRKNQYC